MNSWALFHPNGSIMFWQRKQKDVVNSDCMFKGSRVYKCCFYFEQRLISSNLPPLLISNTQINNFQKIKTGYRKVIMAAIQPNDFSFPPIGVLALDIFMYF